MKKTDNYRKSEIINIFKKTMTNKDFSTILGISVSSVYYYSHPEKMQNREIKRTYSNKRYFNTSKAVLGQQSNYLDIDTILKESKEHPFVFAFEKDQESMLDGMISSNMKLEPIQCFFSVKEIQHILESEYNIRVSTMSIRRKIANQEVPAIRLGKLIRIPLKEFKNLDVEVLFQDKRLNKYQKR